MEWGIEQHSSFGGIGDSFIGILSILIGLGIALGILIKGESNTEPNVEPVDTTDSIITESTNSKPVNWWCYDPVTGEDFRNNAIEDAVKQIHQLESDCSHYQF